MWILCYKTGKKSPTFVSLTEGLPGPYGASVRSSGARTELPAAVRVTPLIPFPTQGKYGSFADTTQKQGGRSEPFYSTVFHSIKGPEARFINYSNEI